MNISKIFLLFFIFQKTYTSFIGEQNFLKNLQDAVSLSENSFELLYQMANKESVHKKSTSDTNLLFQYYPVLQQKIPYIALGSFPTPIQKLKNLGDILKHDNLYIKRDDLSGKLLENGTRLFGGNKVRKLEFLLADAITSGATSVLTWGGVGSNHAVATACYAQHLGLKSICLIKPQPNSHAVRKNLKLLRHFNAHIKPCPNSPLRDIQTVATFIEQKANDGHFPYFIPTGGSIPTGITGFINAAFELKQQIEAGELPEPHKIYIPAGSWGSAVGLLIGKKIARLKTKLMIVAIEPEEYNNQHRDYLFELFEKTNQFLNNLDNTFPKLTLSEDDFEINHKFTGIEYGRYTKEGYNAKQCLKKNNINLDGTYSAKTMAAMISDLSKMENKTETILFWLTYCSDPFETKISTIDYKQLPSLLHFYFENPVQQFDN